MFEFNATLIVAMISFAVFIMIMNAILYKPILSVIEERKAYINKANSDAKDSKNKAQNILDKKEQHLNEASIKAKQIISNRIEEENNNANEITKNAKNESLREINNAKQALHDDEIRTTEELKANIKELAETISSKVLGENFAIENVDNEIINKALR